MISKEWIDSAEKRLSKKIIQTPCTYDPEINAYLKWENHQETGSFKLRGALNKVLVPRVPMQELYLMHLVI